MLVSAVQRSESTICTHISPPSWTSVPLDPYPTPLGHHRAPSWPSSAIQQAPTKLSIAHMVVYISEETMAPHSSTLAWKTHGRRSLVGCSPWGRWGSDATEWLHFHFSLSCIGEGNGNPLQCSCLENPRDSGAWWAAIYGVAQSRTWLKRLSGSVYIHKPVYVLKLYKQY